MASNFSTKTLNTLNDSFYNATAREILEHGLQHFQKNIAISFSGAEDVVLIDLAAKSSLNFRVFTLDTGRLHSETYEYLEKVRQHYSIEIEVCLPDAATLSEFVQKKGLFSFYDDGHNECCGIRKVGPLRRKLQTLEAWVTGQRHDQSPGTRQAIPFVQLDTGFGSEASPLIKYNPLSNWTSERVWSYIRNNNVPYNALHEKGFTSIGCQPCTRAVLPNQHEREGRWWWEAATQKECGLHAINVQPKE